MHCLGCTQGARTFSHAGSTAIALVLSLISLTPLSADAQVLRAGNVVGQPGQTVWFDVSLEPQGASIAGTSHTIPFDPAIAPIV
jgi:hypothetical protein